MQIQGFGKECRSPNWQALWKSWKRYIQSNNYQNNCFKSLILLLLITRLQHRDVTVANAGSDVAICKGASTTLDGSGGGTYSWSPAYGLSATNIANPVANPGVTTTYTLTVINGGCTNTDKVSRYRKPSAGRCFRICLSKIDHNRP